MILIKYSIIVSVICCLTIMLRRIHKYLLTKKTTIIEELPLLEKNAVEMILLPQNINASNVDSKLEDLAERDLD